MRGRIDRPVLLDLPGHRLGRLQHRRVPVLALAEGDQRIRVCRAAPPARAQLRPGQHPAQRHGELVQFRARGGGPVERDAVLGGLQLAQHARHVAQAHRVQPGHRHRLQPLLQRDDAGCGVRPGRLRHAVRGQQRLQRRRHRLLQVEQALAAVASLAAHQHHPARQAERAGAHHPPLDIEHPEEVRIGLHRREAGHEVPHPILLGRRRLQHALPVDLQPARRASAAAALVQKRLGIAPAQLVEQFADHAIGHVALDPEGLAAPQRLHMGLQSGTAQRPRVLGIDPQRVGAHPQAGEQPQQVPARRRQRRLVEVVDVEVGLAVVALVAADILEMQVAAAPDRRRTLRPRLEQRQPGRQPPPEQSAGRTQEDEGALAHAVVLALQPLGLAAGVVLEDLVNDVHREGLLDAR
ncbi:hypothetical protein MASR2M32_23790 [Sphaerotilus sulfidivorans]